MPRTSRLMIATVACMIAAPLPASAQAAATPQLRDKAIALAGVCRGDYQSLCRGISPGGGRVVACLDDHAKQLSPGCARAMPQARALKSHAAQAGALPQ